MPYPIEGDADEGDHGETYRRIWNRIDPKEVADLTLDLVSIPSPTGDELGVSKFYANALTEFGLEVQLNYVEEGRPNVFARIPGSGGGGKRSLLLHGHLDTVPIGGCTPPRIEGGRIYGRGSCDMKGSLAAMALAARGLLRAGARLRGDLILVGTVDHESPPGTGKGIRGLVKKIKGEGIRVDGAINTEGPFDAIKVAQGGCAMFTITLTREGGTLYSATAPFSANPILWASELIARLAEMDAALELRRRHPLISQRPTVQAGIIRGGDFLFSVPDSVRLEGAIRWDPDDEFGRVSEELRTSLRELEGRLRAKYDATIRVEADIRIDREECEAPRDSQIVLATRKILKSISGREYPLVGSRYVTDLSVLQKEAGIPSVEFGPFLPDDITNHTDHESVNVDHLHMLSKVFAATAFEICG